eukprot:ctg_1452.g339
MSHLPSGTRRGGRGAGPAAPHGVPRSPGNPVSGAAVNAGAMASPSGAAPPAGGVRSGLVRRQQRRLGSMAQPSNASQLYALAAAEAPGGRASPRDIWLQETRGPLRGLSPSPSAQGAQQGVSAPAVDGVTRPAGDDGGEVFGPVLGTAKTGEHVDEKQLLKSGLTLALVLAQEHDDVFHGRYNDPIAQLTGAVVMQKWATPCVLFDAFGKRTEMSLTREQLMARLREEPTMAMTAAGQVHQTTLSPAEMPAATDVLATPDITDGARETAPTSVSQTLDLDAYPQVRPGAVPRCARSGSGVQHRADAGGARPSDSGGAGQPHPRRHPVQPPVSVRCRLYAWTAGSPNRCATPAECRRRRLLPVRVCGAGGAAHRSLPRPGGAEPGETHGAAGSHHQRHRGGGGDQAEHAAEPAVVVQHTGALGGGDVIYRCGAGGLLWDERGTAALCGGHARMGVGDSHGCESVGGFGFLPGGVRRSFAKRSALWRAITPVEAAPLLPGSSKEARRQLSTQRCPPSADTPLRCSRNTWLPCSSFNRLGRKECPLATQPALRVARRSVWAEGGRS